MKEIPFLCFGHEVRAIRAGAKTQIRRPCNPQPSPEFLARGVVDVVPQWPLQNGVRWFMADGLSELVSCPFGQPGGHLWVRETWASLQGVGLKYRADNPDAAKPSEYWDVPWKPSIFMPRWASRLTLKVLKLGVQRVQDITRDDALDEGVDLSKVLFPTINAADKALALYPKLWDSIYAKRGYPWNANPYLWVIKFKVV